MAMRAEGKKCANRSFLIGPDGQMIARYDKIHMFDVQLNAGNVYRELDSFAAGAEAVIASLPAGQLGLTVCYDVRFPDLYRQLAVGGAKIIAVPAAFTRITGEAHWHILLRSRAIETGCYIIAPAQGGKHQDGRETYGHSLIVDPWGEILAEAGVRSRHHHRHPRPGESRRSPRQDTVAETRPPYPFRPQGLKRFQIAC